MKHVVALLEIDLETLVTNEPINRAAGNTEQAELEAVTASEIRQALAILKAADAGPIWPEPYAEAEEIECQIEHAEEALRGEHSAAY